jgi:hypothetical protein
MSFTDTADALLDLRARLWPRADKPGPEALAIWRRVCRGITEPDALESLRFYAEGSKWAPTPAEFREAHRRRCPQANTTGATPNRPKLTDADLLRASWAKGDARRAALGDAEIRREFAAWEFDRAMDTYGPTSRTTAAKWQTWRDSLEAPDGVASAAWSMEGQTAFDAAIESGRVTLPDNYRPRKAAPVEAAA